MFTRVSQLFLRGNHHQHSQTKYRFVRQRYFQRPASLLTLSGLDYCNDAYHFCPLDRHLDSWLSTIFELNQRFFWVESASDEFLELIYVNSSCLIAPSYGEGFGLPLIEAAQHHLPIIARNLPVFNEVAKDNAFYFDGFNAADLAQAIDDWLDLYEKKQHPTSSNLQWQNWHGSTQQLWKRILELKK